MSDNINHAEFNEVKLKVGLIEKDINIANRQCERVTEKFTQSIEKLEEVNSNIAKMISIHEQKHYQHEKIEMDLKEDIKELNIRITNVSKETTDSVAQLERNISEKLDNLRIDLQNFQLTKAGITEENMKYKWMVIGGALVVGWIFGNIATISKFLSLFN